MSTPTEGDDPNTLIITGEAPGQPTNRIFEGHHTVRPPLHGRPPERGARRQLEGTRNGRRRGSVPVLGVHQALDVGESRVSDLAGTFVAGQQDPAQLGAVADQFGPSLADVAEALV